MYELAQGLGGINSLRIVNPSTSLNIELRLGGVAGETLGYAPAGYLETTLKLQDGNFNVFPVFKRYNSFRDVVETVYPKRSDEMPWFTTFSLGDFGPPTGAIREHTINMRDLLGGLKMTSGTAWIIVDNQTLSGVRFMEGGTIRKTMSGLENTMPGYPLTFQIDMNRLSTNNYADSRVLSNLRFGPTSEEVSLQTGENNSTLLASLTVEMDKMYTVTVSGDHNAQTLKAWVSNVKDIDVSDFNMN